jgi:hypothetical protein
MEAPSAYGQASQFFGRAYGDLTRAANNQIRADGPYTEEDHFDSQDDNSYMSGAVPPQTGTTPPTGSKTYNLEAIKRELFSVAKQRQQDRSSDGSVIIRAGGGSNPAIRS